MTFNYFDYQQPLTVRCPQCQHSATVTPHNNTATFACPDCSHQLTTDTSLQRNKNWQGPRHALYEGDCTGGCGMYLANEKFPLKPSDSDQQYHAFTCPKCQAPNKLKAQVIPQDDLDYTKVDPYFGLPLIN